MCYVCRVGCVGAGSVRRSGGGSKEVFEDGRSLVERDTTSTVQSERGAATSPHPTDAFGALVPQRSREKTSSPPVRPTKTATRALTSSPFFFQAEDGIRDLTVTGVQTCA